MPYSANSTHYDYTIVGGGIVGVATALHLQKQQPNAAVLLIEKESAVAQHQTSHNSGVIHAGVYYQPGSLKADFCKRGSAATLDYCQQHNIPVKQPGKLLVATNDIEYQRMLALKQRCEQNGIDTTLLDKSALQREEPNITGVAALLVETSAIVDYQAITQSMVQQFQRLGGTLQLATELKAAKELTDRITLHTSRGTIDTGFLISCSGLMSDRCVKMLGIKSDFAIIPFRGEYYQLREQHNRIVKRLIYPIPDPALPFLGVHLTPMINGSITVGPNAVLGWKREGYQRFNFSLSDTVQVLSFPGFWRLSKAHLRSGLNEFKNSVYKRGYLQQVQKYCPQLQQRDLEAYPAGIRAQAVKLDGSLVQDFLFAESTRSLHVCNAPSPAATSAIPIAEYIVEKVSLKRTC